MEVNRETGATQDNAAERVRQLGAVVAESGQVMRGRFYEMNQEYVKLLGSYDVPRSEQFITRAGSDDAVAWGHEQVILRPKARIEPREDIIEMILRFPMTGEMEVGREEKHPKDLFVELMYANGVFMRYLVNEDGLQAYRSGADIDVKEDVDLDDLDKSIFRVSNEPTMLPEVASEKLEILELIHELLVAYRPVPHDNTSTIDAA